MGTNRLEARKPFHRLVAFRNRMDSYGDQVYDSITTTISASSSSIKFSKSDSLEYNRVQQDSSTEKTKANMPTAHASEESSTHAPEISNTPTSTESFSMSSNDHAIVSKSSSVSMATSSMVTTPVLKQISSDAQKGGPPFKSTSLENLYKYGDQNDSTGAYSAIHKSRILNIRNACRNKSLFENQMYLGHYSTIYYGSDKYDFAYCKVPKSGSTFWTQAFGVLKHGVEYGETIFTEKRSQVHGHRSEYTSSFDMAKKNRSRTILVSRDPYSRLFSAFIDKSYLPLLSKLNYQIRDVPSEFITDINTPCAFDLQFKEFLAWVVREGANQKLNRHWAPIISLCRPCEVNAFILVKQESFSKDVEFTLRQVGVGGEEFEYIMSALRGHRADLSLPGIIETVYAQNTKSIVKKCLGYEGIAERLWHSFQVQGFINKRIEFPKRLFTSGSKAVSNATYFSNVVLNTLQEHPMNSTQSKLQRQEELVNAYEDIGQDIIKGIQTLYKQDFEIFGYSNEPPRRTHEN